MTEIIRDHLYMSAVLWLLISIYVLQNVLLFCKRKACKAIFDDLSWVLRHAKGDIDSYIEFQKQKREKEKDA